MLSKEIERMRQFRRQAANRGVGYPDKAEPDNSNCFQIFFLSLPMKIMRTKRETQHVFPFPINQHQTTDFLLLILLSNSMNCSMRGGKDEWETKN